jgi:hypothetical protein
MIKDTSISHHWSHCAYVFCLSGITARIIKIVVGTGLIDSQTGLVFGGSCVLVASGYWLFWFLSELNEIIPRENHRNLFLRSRFSWRAILSRTNFFELVYRITMLVSIVFGALIGSIN